MKVSKWGNSLAVRLPKHVVDALALKENDEVDLIAAADKRTLTVERNSEDSRRAEAIARLRKYRGWMPVGFKFNRDEAHERD